MGIRGHIHQHILLPFDDTAASDLCNVVQSVIGPYLFVKGFKITLLRLLLWCFTGVGAKGCKDTAPAASPAVPAAEPDTGTLASFPLKVNTLPTLALRPEALTTVLCWSPLMLPLTAPLLLGNGLVQELFPGMGLPGIGLKVRSLVPSSMLL